VIVESCQVPLADDRHAIATLIERDVDIEWFTRTQSAILRLVALARFDRRIWVNGWTPSDSFATLGRLELNVRTSDRTFQVPEGTDRIGTAPLVLKEVSLAGDPVQSRKFIGVPDAASDTIRKWRMRLRYKPADATIDAVRVKAVSAEGYSEDLAFHAPAI